MNRIEIECIDNVIKKITNDVKNKVIELINHYPVYGSDSQVVAQQSIKKFLEHNGWEVIEDRYYFSDILKFNPNRPYEYSDEYSEYEKIEKVNIYGILDSKKSGPIILLNGHIDVDIIGKNNRKAFVKNNIIYGRGSSDMITGLVSLVTVGNFIQSIEWCGKIIFMSVVDEEIGGNGSLRGINYLKMLGINISEASLIIAEPTECEICNACMGFIPFEINIKNKIGHMNNNNNNIIYEIFSKLKELNMKEDINVNLGLIYGGVDPSLPIENLNIKGVISNKPSIDNEYIKKTLKNIVNSHNNVTIKLPKFQLESVIASKKFLGKYYKYNLFKSACDLSVINSEVKNAIIFGPGSLEQAHSENEYIEINQIEIYLKKLYLLLFDIYKRDSL